MRNKIIITTFFLLLTACTVQSTEPGELRTIRLPMGFIPNIQYAPYYVAIEKGYFAEVGIEIEFDYSFETDGVNLVGINETQFALVSGEQVLLARAQEVPVVYVTAWFQEYPVAIVAKSSSGIQSPADLAGKEVGLPFIGGASYIGLQAVLNKLGVDEDTLTLNAIGFNQVESLATDQAAAVVGYFSNEPIQLRAQGYDVVEFRVADYVQLASNGLITNEETIANDPELIKAMVGAFLKGLADTIENPEEAYEISLKYVEGLEADDPVQMEVLTISIEFWEADHLGHSNPTAWENMQAVLLDLNLLENPLDLSAAFTNDFIE